MNMYKKVILSTFVVVTFISSTAFAAMTPISFSCITNNNAANCTVGESQFSMEVLNVPTAIDKVQFKFFNTGTNASSIDGIYFDDGTLLGISQIINNGANISFSSGGTPALSELPGNTLITPTFVTTQDFLVTVGQNALTMGLNPGEWLAIEFSLKKIQQGTQQVQQTYASVINDLSTGKLRVGLHAINFQSGGLTVQESFVSTPVPLPPALLLFGSGLLLLFGRKRILI